MPIIPIVFMVLPPLHLPLHPSCGCAYGLACTSLPCVTLNLAWLLITRREFARENETVQICS